MKKMGNTSIKGMKRTPLIKRTPLLCPKSGIVVFRLCKCVSLLFLKIWARCQYSLQMNFTCTCVLDPRPFQCDWSRNTECDKRHTQEAGRTETAGEMPFEQSCDYECKHVHGDSYMQHTYMTGKQDGFCFFQRKNCPGWDLNPRHSMF